MMKGGQAGGVVTGAINAARSLCGAVQSAGLGLPVQLALESIAASASIFAASRLCKDMVATKSFWRCNQNGERME